MNTFITAALIGVFGASVVGGPNNPVVPKDDMVFIRSCSVGRVTVTALVRKQDNESNNNNATQTDKYSGNIEFKAAKGKKLKKGDKFDYVIEWTDANGVKQTTKKTTSKRSVSYQYDTVQNDSPIVIKGGIKGDGKANCTTK